MDSTDPHEKTTIRVLREYFLFGYYELDEL